MADTWLKQLDEALRIADEITANINESGGMSKGERTRSLASTRRKFVLLENKVRALDSQLQTVWRPQLPETELYRRQESLIALRHKMKQLDASLKNSQNARDDLLSEGTRVPVETNKTVGLDNYGLVAFQRQVMREQDEDLVDLEKSVVSTKHIVLTMNEELDQQNVLLNDIDMHVDHTGSLLARVNKKLVVVSKRAGGMSLGYMCILLLVIVVLVLVVLKLVKIL